MIYSLVKKLMRVALYCYFREIRFHGMDRVPRDRPVMLLPNHQNALLDPLLVAACMKGARPYFLTRSDVFQGKFLKAVFSGLRMLPVYRLRDGRETLGRNQAIFDRCAELLHRGEPLLLFPEANHNLKRQVRPLSKGFTRIVTLTLTQYPDTDLQLLPVGINYQDAAGFPDRVAYEFGRPFAAAPILQAGDAVLARRTMIEAVSRQLQGLTTHIPTDADYDRLQAGLDALHPDYLQPDAINRYLAGESEKPPVYRQREGFLCRLWEAFFRLVNLPVLLLWRYWMSPRVPMAEFRSTYRFAFALFSFPVYLLLLGAALAWLGGTGLAWLGPPALFFHNLLYVKRR